MDYKDTIIKSFRHVGLTLNPNGSEDAELKIKGIPDVEVGDYHQEVLINQEDEAEEALVVSGAVDGQRKAEAQCLCDAKGKPLRAMNLLHLPLKKVSCEVQVSVSNASQNGI